ncbi:MAG: hypothetical protein H5U30_03380, partial [Marinobacter sp.]|nr:hypothetical protein [Marinobacter sp.]
MKKTRLSMIALASTFLVAGCSSVDTIASGTDNPCGTLRSIVADYPTGFDAYRGTGSSYKMVTIYRAKEQLIRGHCEIWAWGAGDSAYTCTLGAPNPDVSEALYSKAAGQLAQCLGPDWSVENAARERDGKPAGEISRFLNTTQGSPVVSLHRVEDNARQSVYLY